MGGLSISFLISHWHSDANNRNTIPPWNSFANHLCLTLLAEVCMWLWFFLQDQDALRTSVASSFCSCEIPLVLTSRWFILLSKLYFSHAPSWEDRKILKGVLRKNRGHSSSSDQVRGCSGLRSTAWSLPEPVCGFPWSPGQSGHCEWQL